MITTGKDCVKHPYPHETRSGRWERTAWQCYSQASKKRIPLIARLIYCIDASSSEVSLKAER